MARERQLKSNFKGEGVFWDPRTPDQSFPGTLIFDPAQGIELQAAAAAAHPSQMFGGNEDPEATILHGQVQGRGACTILFPHVIKTESSFGLGGVIQSRHFRAHSAVFGELLDSPDAPIVEEMRVEFAYLDEWLGSVRVQMNKSEDIEEPFVVTFPYRRHSFLSSSVQAIDATVEVYKTLNWQNDMLGNFRGSYPAIVAVKSTEKHSIDWCLRVLWRLQNLFSLIFGFSTTPVEVTLISGSKPVTPIELLFRVNERATSGKRDPSTSLQFTEQQLSNTVQKWFGTSPEFRRVEDLLLGTYYSANTYVESEFLSLAQGIESFHRVTRLRTLVDGKIFQSALEFVDKLLENSPVPEVLREKFREVLQFANDLSFQTRIDELLESLSNPQAQQIVGDKETFSRTLKQTRNYLTHPGIKKKGCVLDSPAELYRFNRRLQAILRILVLAHVGVDLDITAPPAYEQVRAWQ